MRCVHTPRSSQQTVPWIRHATHFSPSINRFLIGRRYASPTNGPPWPNSTFIRLTWSLYLATVFIFTAALFLSGYAIQQRTLRDLRAAIKPTPRPSPRTYLPDQFKKMTTELPDGTIAPVQDDEVVIEITPTPPSEVHQTSETEDENRQKPILAPQPAQESATEKTEMKKTSSARAKKYREQQQLKKQQQQHMQQEGLVVQQGQQHQEQDFSKTPNQAEQQETSGSTPIEIPEGMLEHPDPDKRAEKAVSPAERRRLIKEEIKRLAQPEERGYYQRRLW